MNTTQYTAWIQQQLEPTEVLRTGNYKRITPLWVDKNKAIDAMIEKMGIEEYKRRVAEDAEREREQYYY